MSIETVARRYATALADVVVKTSETKTVKSELKAVGRIIASNPELENAFRNPVTPHLKKEKVLESLLAKGQAFERRRRISCASCLRNGRLTDLKEINERFAQCSTNAAGSSSAESHIVARAFRREEAELENES